MSDSTERSPLRPESSDEVSADHPAEARMQRMTAILDEAVAHLGIDEVIDRLLFVINKAGQLPLAPAGPPLDIIDVEHDLDGRPRPDRSGPRGRTVVRPRDLGPRPLASTSMTLCLPSDPCPMTLETVVLAMNPSDEEETARASDVPVLAQAGWSQHDVGPLRIYSRVIAG